MSDEQTCSTCRWWINDSGRTIAPPTNTRRCRSPKVVFGLVHYVDGVPNATVTVDATTLEPISDDEAAVLDGDGFGAMLRPGPAFGCRHHEGR